MAEKRATEVVTGEVRLSYANIWEARAIEEGGEKKFSATLLIPKTDKKMVAAIKKAQQAAVEEGTTKVFGGKITGLKMALRDGDTDEKKSEDENYAGHYFLSCSSKTQPGIVDENVKKVFDQAQVYSGCYIRADINFYPFAKKGNRGVAVGLNNIMKVRDGEPLAGRRSAEDAFKEFGSDDVDLKEDDIDEDDMLS